MRHSFGDDTISRLWESLGYEASGSTFIPTSKVHANTSRTNGTPRLPLDAFVNEEDYTAGRLYPLTDEERQIRREAKRVRTKNDQMRRRVERE